VRWYSGAWGVHGAFSGDRTRPFRTKLPVNQGYLNQIAAPPELAVLTPVFEELAQAERAGKLPPLRIAVGRLM